MHNFEQYQYYMIFIGLENVAHCQLQSETEALQLGRFLFNAEPIVRDFMPTRTRRVVQKRSNGLPGYLLIGGGGGEGDADLRAARFRRYYTREEKIDILLSEEQSS